MGGGIRCDERVRGAGKSLARWIPVALWMGLIYGGSTGAFSSEHTSRILVPLMRWLFPGISAEALELVEFVARKCFHLGEYAVLGGLCSWALHRRGAPSGNWRMGAAAALCAAYALSDEWHQSFVPGRVASGWDVLIDVAGACLGIILFRGSCYWRARGFRTREPETERPSLEPKGSGTSAPS